MQLANFIALAAVGLIVARLGAQYWLEWLNQKHVLRHARKIPEAVKDVMDEATYGKSVQYTMAQSQFAQFEVIYSSIVLLLVLFSDLLPWGFRQFQISFGYSAWAMAAFLFLAGFILSLPNLPLDWYSQFHIEERFGFNTTTQNLWWMDKLKGLLIGMALGIPLLALVLKIVAWSGEQWWLWGWGAVLAFQFLMLVLAPVLILPLFNKFTPLPEGSLRERLLALAARTNFRARSIQIMDGSKRSRHSNAFFTGFGKFRKIVLFDTLVQQLSGPELEAVVAHEIGHFKKKHIPKILLAAAAGLLAGFFAIAWLAKQEWFYRAFGFQPGSIVPVFLLFGLLSGVIPFWFSPLAHWWSRRYEYAADAFAAKVLNQAQSLIAALRKLNKKNLSNLTPHPLYSRFYYSHPTLLERERALADVMRDS